MVTVVGPRMHFWFISVDSFLTCFCIPVAPFKADGCNGAARLAQSLSSEQHP